MEAFGGIDPRAVGTWCSYIAMYRFGARMNEPPAPSRFTDESSMN